MCKQHVCRGLADSTTRQVHWIVSGVLDRAVVWRWISVNPAEHVSKPAVPHPTLIYRARMRQFGLFYRQGRGSRKVHDYFNHAGAVATPFLRVVACIHDSSDLASNCAGPSACRILRRQIRAMGH